MPGLDESTELCYVVFCPSSTEKGPEAIKTKSQKEALDVVKKNPGARFYRYSSEEEAEKVIKTGSWMPAETKKYPGEASPVPEPTQGFPSVTCSMLSELRMIVESGDVEKLKEVVWSNPKYLVTSADLPTLLREGKWRRNAFHIAAFAAQPEVLAVLLAILRDPDFVRLLYPNDSDTQLEEKAKHLLDSYLNNKEPKEYNSPLHFAATRGCAKAVELLASCPECNRTATNIRGMTPFDLIPSDGSVDEDSRRRMRQLLAPRVVVLLGTSSGRKLEVRDADPSKFCLKSESLVDDEFEIEEEKLRAVAGPVPADLLNDFLSSWKRGDDEFLSSLGDGDRRCPRRDGAPASAIPARVAGDFVSNGTVNSVTEGGDLLSPLLKRKKRQFSSAGLDVKLSDYAKGMERIGRALCQRYQIPWSERWDFLDDFLDINSDEGLQKLEKFFEDVKNEMILTARTLTQDAYLEVLGNADGEVGVPKDRIVSNGEANFDVTYDGRNRMDDSLTPPGYRVKPSKLVLRRFTSSPMDGLPTSPVERPSNPIPPSSPASPAMDESPLAFLCQKMAALSVRSPSSPVKTMSNGGNGVAYPRRSLVFDDRKDEEIETEENGELELVTGSLVVSVSPDIEITESEEDENMEKSECVELGTYVGTEVGDLAEEEEDDGMGEEDAEGSFETAPGSPRDGEWRMARPSFFIGWDYFVQEDAQVFIALRDGGFPSRTDTDGFPNVQDWYTRVSCKFTSKEIDERARNRGQFRSPQTSLASSPLSSSSHSQCSTPLKRPMTAPLLSLFPAPNAPASAPRLPSFVSSPTLSVFCSSSLSSPGLAYSPREAIENAFASPKLKSRRKSLNTH